MNKLIRKSLYRNSFYSSIKKFYHPTRELMKKQSTVYYSDPNQVGEEIIRIISRSGSFKYHR